MPSPRSATIAPAVPASPVARAGVPAARQDMDNVSVERHGTQGQDIRDFIVARKPA
jgi:hypothetical protein